MRRTCLRHRWSPVWMSLLLLLPSALLCGGASAQAATPVAGAIGPKASCASLATRTIAQTSLATAVPVTMNGHDFCAVRGYFSPQTQFEVLLPTTTWRGNYLQQGCGGFCGHLDLSLTDAARTSGYQAPFAPLLNGEMVVAADDQGHQTATNGDALWGVDPFLKVVYGYSSEHSLQAVAKALIRAYYGRGPSYSYFSGVSDGGHEALVLAQRYPTDFNGIIAGAPINNLAPWAGLSQPWMIRANQDSHGRQVLTSEKLPALHSAVMKACADATGVIRDPRACTFDPGTLLCPKGVDTAGCLTAAQVRTVRSEYRGATDAGGRNLFDGGEPYGSELAWDTWLIKPAADRAAPDDTYAAPLGLQYLKYLASMNSYPSLTLRDVAFTKAQHDRLQVLGGIYNATDPDLRPFQAAGGKIILYHGWADQGVSPFTSVNYYGAVARTLGLSRSQTFSRLYMIPGLYHCPCGQAVDGDPATQVQLLPQLTQWVEHGRAPGALALPVTSPSSGTATTGISVRPFNPLAPAPNNRGLNSNYHYVGLTSTYRSGTALWCPQGGSRLICTHRKP
jgi:Tannase and feruloyl esterase